jgi:hypothetical protein
MIIHDHDNGFLGFDYNNDAKNLSASIAFNGDVVLTWDGTSQQGLQGWYNVYYSHTRDGFFGTAEVDYFQACPSIGFGTTNAFHLGAKANDPKARLYYIVVPYNASGIVGSSTYSLGIWTEEYLAQYDTVGLPLKQKNTKSVDWYCDNIPDTVGMNFYINNEQRWSWHSTRMPQGAFDPDIIMTEGYQISTSASTKYTFIGV